MENNQTPQLTLIRDLLAKEKINPELAIEFFCTANELESKKDSIRKISKNKCHFFTKEIDGKYHLIVLINIVIKKLSKDSELKDLIETNKMNESKFSPKTISFFGN